VDTEVPTRRGGLSAENPVLHGVRPFLAPSPVISDGVSGFATATPRAGRRSRLLDRALARPSSSAIGGLVAAVVLFGLLVPDLLTAGGLAGVLDVAATLGIGAVAVALLLVAGQFDFSIGALAGASALLSALLVVERGWSAWPALGAGLVAALLVGVVNGVLVVNTGLPSFLVTLATLLVLQGLVSHGIGVITDSGRVDFLDDAPGWAAADALFASGLEVGGGRFRVSLLWFLAVTAVATWALWRTRFGNALFAIGGAPRAATELGVPVRRTTVTLFCLTAGAGWLIGVLALTRVGGAVAAVPGLASGVDFLVVAVIGGCLLTGGWGSVFGAAVASVLYAVARQGISLAGWDPQWFQMLLGVLLLVALVANGIVLRRLKAAPRS
jgi:simple sugar transport system permease protein